MGHDNPHFEAEDDTGVTIENLNILGTAPGGYVASLEAQHGFYIVGGTGVTVDKVSVNAVYGDFVSLENDASGRARTNITVENGQFGAASSGDAGAGRQELTIDDGSRT